MQRSELAVICKTMLLEMARKEGGPTAELRTEMARLKAELASLVASTVAQEMLSADERAGFEDHDLWKAKRVLNATYERLQAEGLL